MNACCPGAPLSCCIYTFAVASSFRPCLCRQTGLLLASLPHAVPAAHTRPSEAAFHSVHTLHTTLLHHTCTSGRSSAPAPVPLDLPAALGTPPYLCPHIPHLPALQADGLPSQPLFHTLCLLLTRTAEIKLRFHTARTFSHNLRAPPTPAQADGPPAQPLSHTLRLLLKRDLALGYSPGFSREQQRHLCIGRPSSLPLHAQRRVDCMDARAYIGQYSADGTFFVAAFQVRLECGVCAGVQRGRYQGTAAALYFA